MQGDHAFFVGRDDQHGNPAGLRIDLLLMRVVRGFVELDAEQRLKTRAYGCPDRCGVLADAGSEHQAVEPAQRDGELADFLRDPRVEGIFSETVSIAERIATLGRSMPSACTSSIALRTMSALSVRLGKMLTAASVMKSGL